MSLDDTERLRLAAKRLLDHTMPFAAALELDPYEWGISGEALYADLAEALGLGRDYQGWLTRDDT